LNPEPIFDVAHLAHVELLTPKPEESLRFFVDVMGMLESGRQGDSVFLRGWDDYEHHSLQLTASRLPGLGHYALRAASLQALSRRVDRLERSGLGLGWNDKNTGHGPAFCFTDPDGHRMEIYYETEWHRPAETLKPALRNQASRFPNRGIALRRIDHINLLAADVRATRTFLQEALGGRMTEQIVFDDGSEKASWITFTNKTYDVAISEDWTGSKGRLHHLTYAVDSREDILRAADICLENGVFIETGPHKHAVQQTFFLYVYEPGGNRFEIANAGARLMLAPDWQPVIWSEAERKKGQAWGLPTIPSFHTHGTPPVD
jgi:catechol 2,3-dioxygenase